MPIDWQLFTKRRTAHCVHPARVADCVCPFSLFRAAAVIFACTCARVEKEQDEQLAPGEYWEEVDLDEHGNPIEATARAVSEVVPEPGQDPATVAKPPTKGPIF